MSKSGEDSINSNIAIGLGVASSIFRNIKHSFQYPIQNYRETKRIYDRRKTISKDPEQAIDPNPTQTIESNTKNKFKDELAPLNGPAVQSVLRVFIANPNTVFKHAKINEIRKVKDSGKHLRTLTDMKLLQQQIDRNARGYNYTLNPEKLTEIEKIKPLLLNGSTTIDEINAYNMNNTKGASL